MIPVILHNVLFLTKHARILTIVVGTSGFKYQYLWKMNITLFNLVIPRGKHFLYLILYEICMQTNKQTNIQRIICL